MGVVRKEVSDRTLFGKIVKWIFIAFNVLMLLWIVGGLLGSSGDPPMSDAEQTGRAIGTAIGVGLLLMIWTMGDVILGIVVLLTRRKKIIEVEE